MNSQDKNAFISKPTSPSKETIEVHTETKGTIIMQPNAWEALLQNIGINHFCPPPKN
jgi:hypothetical protein